MYGRGALRSRAALDRCSPGAGGGGDGHIGLLSSDQRSFSTETLLKELKREAVAEERSAASNSGSVVPLSEQRLMAHLAAAL